MVHKQMPGKDYSHLKEGDIEAYTGAKMERVHCYRRAEDGSIEMREFLEPGGEVPEGWYGSPAHVPEEVEKPKRKRGRPPKTETVAEKPPATVPSFASGEIGDEAKA